MEPVLDHPHRCCAGGRYQPSTIYNEFGSRQGLAEGYAGSADRLVVTVDARSTTMSDTSERGLLRGVPRLLSWNRHRTQGRILAAQRQPAATCCRSSPPTAARSSPECSKRRTETFPARLDKGHRMRIWWLARPSSGTAVSCHCPCPGSPTTTMPLQDLARPGDAVRRAALQAVVDTR